MKITQTDVIQGAGAKMMCEGPMEYSGIGSDTRKNLQDLLFIALRGDSFDAHLFLDKAIEQKAGALLIHEVPSPELLKKAKEQKVGIFTVPDTLVALQKLASYMRQQLNPVVIGITGSNGKTTSKEFTAAVLSDFKPVHFSRGSFNNHWGVPFSLLDMSNEHQIAVMEMGMNHAGEITELVRIANPDIVVCSVVGTAHIEHFGTIEGIAKAKAEIYEASKPTNKKVFNLDNPHTFKMYQHWKQRVSPELVYTFSQAQESATVMLTLTEATMSSLKLQGRIGGLVGEVVVPVFGTHNITNILVAATVAKAAGMKDQDIWASLPKCKTIWGRNQVVKTSVGAEVLFDAYNANPDSMKALLDNIQLISTSGKKIAVFGQMKELGEHSEKAHFELGAQAGLMNFSHIWFYGPDCAAFEAGAKSVNFKNSLIISNDYNEELALKTASVLNPKDIVIVKGSRGMKMERFVLLCDPLDFSLDKTV